MLKADYIVAGSGLTGATIARTLQDNGRDVVVLERRQHVGGNVYDQVHSSGIRFHIYGPHYFRTSCDKLWEWVQRFSSFYKFEARVQTYIEGRYYQWPLKPEDRYLYDKAVNGYNKKMWGREGPPEEAIKRIEMRDNNDPRLKTDKYQGLPELGYAGFIQNLLKDIRVLTGVDYLKSKGSIVANKKLIFTGPIDEYYDFDLGRLEYRAQLRKLLWSSSQHPNLPCVQVNRPGDEVSWLRSIEWNQLAKHKTYLNGMLATYEYPYSPSDPNCYEYPYNNERNKTLYKQYRMRADADRRLLVCGRLGDYCYRDMDSSIGRALMLADRILEE